MKSNKKSKILEKFGLNKKDYYLIVGRLIPDNNSKIIIEGFLKSNSKKSIVIVGDVPYNDNYANDIKSLSSEKVIFTGYVNDQIDLTVLYDNCYGYIHGHEFGGTNPTMINALDLNCQILALDTVFNREMLQSKKPIFFNKNKKAPTKVEAFLSCILLYYLATTKRLVTIVLPTFALTKYKPLLKSVVKIGTLTAPV